MTTYLGDVGDTNVQDKIQMEVYECDCGYHFGIDSTYLDQVGSINHVCLACGFTQYINANNYPETGDYI